MRFFTVLMSVFALGIVGGVSVRKIPGWAETPRGTSTQQQILGAKTNEVRVVIKKNEKKVYLEMAGERVKEMGINQNSANEWVIDDEIWSEWMMEMEKDPNKTGIKVVID